MKRMFFLLGIVAMAIVLVAAGIPDLRKADHHLKKDSACGYRIIEFGVGIDCNGDTVKLVKSRGFQQLVKQEAR